jgi:ubiquinone/menaquinone biosynthesis C-methylase UbiE
MHHEAARSCIDLLSRAKRFPLFGLQVVDFGCGSGTWLLEFIQWGAQPRDVFGIDLSSDRIASARIRLPASELICGNAANTPWHSDSFDVASQFTMFTSILDESLRRAVAKEMLRIVKPGGVILWFDFRCDNPYNRNVRGIGRAEVRDLFPQCRIKFLSTILAPPLARRVAPLSWPLAQLLSAIPVFRTHYAALICKS